MVHFRNFESGLFPTTLRKRNLQLLPRSAPAKAPAFTLRIEQKLELSLTFPFTRARPWGALNPNPEVETADSADSADLRSRADGLCHLQFCSG
jgi:hypothetical protein